MKYAKHGKAIKQNNKQNRIKFGNKNFLTVLVAVMVIGIVGGFFIFGSTSADGEGIDIVDDALAQNSIDETDSDIVENQASNTDQISLTYVGEESGGFSGISRRGSNDGIFSHVIVADLPDINLDEFVYEGWLVRPGLSEFFSTGELFKRADGKWGLVWEIREDESKVEVQDYSRVIVTLESKDGDGNPEEHILEGQFKN